MFDLRKSEIKALDGAVVVAYSCDGCMATDHNIMWVGIVERFDKPARGAPLSQQYDLAVIKIHKRKEGNDSRDVDLGHEQVVVQDGSLQMIVPKLYFYFR